MVKPRGTILAIRMTSDERETCVNPFRFILFYFRVFVVVVYDVIGMMPHVSGHCKGECNNARMGADG